jgi:very-short-patch-repair endonuclease
MFKNIAPKATPEAAALARKLRKEMTLPEVLLWQHFRQRPHGLKFRNQHGTGAYVLDFYCSDARLAIEVDGLAHDNPDRAEHDRRRDTWLASHGIETLRIPAREVLADATQAAQAIVDFTRARLPHHHPAAPGGPPPRDKLGDEQEKSSPNSLVEQ